MDWRFDQQSIIWVEIICSIQCSSNSASVTNMFHATLQQMSLNKFHTCWWYGWRKACHWPTALTHPWVGMTWWKLKSRRGRWWMTCMQQLRHRQRSSQACAATAEENRCKNSSSCLLSGKIGGKSRCVVPLSSYLLFVHNNSSYIDSTVRKTWHRVTF